MVRYEKTVNYKTMQQETLSVPAYALYGIMVLILFLLPAVPSNLRQVIRPLYIGFSILYMKRINYPADRAVWSQILFLVAMAAAWLFGKVNASTLKDYVSVLLFSFFFLLAVQRVWTRREIVVLLHVIVISCAAFALVLLLDNPSLWKLSCEASLFAFGEESNRNRCAFGLCPGAMCSIFLFLFDKNCTVYKKLLYGICGLLCIYVCYATGCRSAFASLAAGSALLMFEGMGQEKPIGNRIAEILAIVIGGYLLIQLLSILFNGTASLRQFDWSDNNGRQALWDQAKELIREKPLFGGGFTYWSEQTGEELDTHNCLLYFMVIGGYTVGIALANFWMQSVIALLKPRNMIPLGFAAETVCHCYSESNMDYYAYIPLILAFIFQRYMIYQHWDLHSLFVKVQEQEE